MVKGNGKNNKLQHEGRGESKMLYVNGPYIEFTDPHPVLNCILRHDINCTDFASCTSITLC